MHRKSLLLLSASALVGTLVLAGAAAASTTTSNQALLTHFRGHGPINGMGMMARQKPTLVGTVTTIHGTALTVTGANAVVYTVDASSAKVNKGPGTFTLADVKVGDTIAVVGTLSGTNVSATSVMDGRMSERTPLVAGTVVAVNGTSFTVSMPAFAPKRAAAQATPRIQSYTVSTNSATTYATDGAAATAADVTVGAHVLVQGTIDKTALTASATKVLIMTNVAKRPMGQLDGMRHVFKR